MPTMEKKVIEKKPEEVVKEKGEFFHQFKLIIDGQEVGWLKAIFFSKPCPTYYLAQVEISPAYRNKRFGVEILEHFNFLLKSKGRMGLLINAIDVEDPSYSIYEDHGWQRLPSRPDWFVFNKPDFLDEKTIAQAIYEINKIEGLVYKN